MSEPKPLPADSVNDHDSTKKETSSEDRVASNASELDLISYHEHNAGRLVIDPEYVWSPAFCAPPLFRVKRSLSVATERRRLSLVKRSPEN